MGVESPTEISMFNFSWTSSLLLNQRRFTFVNAKFRARDEGRQLTSAGQGWPSVPGAMDGVKGLCSLPRIWGRLHGSLLFCFRKDVALVSHCVPGSGRRTGNVVLGGRHISCAPSCLGVIGMSFQDNLRIDVRFRDILSKEWDEKVVHY